METQTQEKISEEKEKEEVIKVIVKSYHHRWGWTAKKIPDNPPLYYHTILGLNGFILGDGKEIKFKHPISIKRFDKYCSLKESNFLDYWVFECNKDYITKLVSSSNARVI
jgi:hypothetical protein